MANRYASDRYERRYDEDREQRDPFNDRYGDERATSNRRYRDRGGPRDEEFESGRLRGRSSIGGAERSGMEDYNRAIGGYGQGYYGGFGREGRMFGQSTGRYDIDHGGKWVDEYSRGSYEGDYEGYGSEYGSLQPYDEGRRQQAARGTPRGRFTGRGPRGYRRSDERIREEVNDRLTDHGDFDASEIEVNVMDGDVVLEGFVDDRRTKRLAEDVAESVSGVRDVINHLRVNWR
jgi:osmotically-inducible protein OsmY